MSGVPDGTWAVVTGASSGIGEALTRGLARRGHDVYLVARREERLRKLAAEVGATYGVRAHVRACDLADRDARAALRADLGATDVAVLCSNAGFSPCGPLAGSDPGREADAVEVNAVATHELTLAVMSGMLRRGTGRILLTGSTAGEHPVPSAATYAATKAFVNVFAEALHVELRGSGVSCTLLAPGPVSSEFTAVGGITDAERHRWMGWSTPSGVAEAALTALERGERLVIPGVMAKLQFYAGRHTPRPVLFPVMDRVILPRLRAADGITLAGS